MVRIEVRKSNDATYLTSDRGLELEGLRDGSAGYWIKGDGDAHDPEQVNRLFAVSNRGKVFGYDLIISAPRPFSILLALGDDDAKGLIRAHRESVRATMAYLEENALVIRDQRAHDDVDIPAKWSEIVAFTHGVNRHGEPHLHDHVIVSSIPEGTHRMLDARAIFAQKRAADALYRANLRAGIAAYTNWSPWRSLNGVDQVRGLDEGYRALWGGKYHDKGEKYHWRRDEIVRKWHSDLTRFEQETVVPAPPLSPHLDEHAFRGAFEGLQRIYRRHIVEAWSNAAVDGAFASDIRKSVYEFYPSLREGIGVRENFCGAPTARMIGVVQERGARPLLARDIEHWATRDLHRDRGSCVLDR